MSFLMGAILAGSLFGPSTQNPSAVRRIVAASQVRLRVAPQTSAEEVARLPLGTLLTRLEASPDGAWYRVSTPEDKSGWIFANLTDKFNERDPIDTYRLLIQARLKIETLNFEDAKDLTEFVESIALQSPASAQAEFSLFRLRALAQSLREIRWYEPKVPEQREWIEKHRTELAYSEPGASWMVDARLYWDLEARFHATPIADEIAWLGAKTGLPGECEGFIACYLDVVLVSEGRYLALHPTGAHVKEAIEGIQYLLQEAVKPDKPFTIDASEVASLRKSTQELSRILEATRSPNAPGMMQALKQIEQIYR